MSVCVNESRRGGKPWSCQNRWEMGRAAGCEGCVGCWRRMNPALGLLLERGSEIRAKKKRWWWDLFSSGCISAEDAVS